MKRPLLLCLLLLALLAVAAVTWQQCSPSGPAAPLAPPTPSAAPGEPHAAATGTQPGAAAADGSRTPAEVQRESVAPASANAEAPQGVRGRVVDRRGFRIAAVQVALIESSSNDPIGRLFSMRQNVPTLPAAATATDRDGGFRLGLAEPTDRDFELCLWADGLANERIGALRIHAGEWLDLGDVAMQPGTTIFGRVTVAGTDLPAPQATVWLESGNPFVDLGPAQLSGWRERQSAAADSNGRYELRNAPRHGLFRLLASAPGFGRQIHDQVELADGPPLEHDFELPRGLSISGQLDTGGRPLGTAQVTVYAKTAEPAFQGIVASDGRFFVHGLREGLHLVKISAEGYRPVDCADVAAGTQDLSVQLQPRGRAGVLVRGDGGMILQRYRVAVRLYFAGSGNPDGADPAQLQGGGQIAAVRDVPERVVNLPPGESTTFVDGLDPGSYVFQVAADGYASTLSPPLVLDPERPEAVVEMTMTHGGTMVGAVLDAAGVPVAGATVATQPHGAADENPVWKMLHSLTPDRITRTAATTDAAGRFELRGLAHARYQLQVDHPGFCRSIVRDLMVADDRAQALPPVRLVRGALVRGTAVVDGRPTAQVQIVLTPEIVPQDGAELPPPKTVDETSVIRVEAVTNNDGSFVMPRRVPPGNYELRGVSQVGSDPATDAFEKLMQMKQSAVVFTVQPGQELVEQQVRIATGR